MQFQPTTNSRSGEKEIEGIVRECSEEINYTVNKEDLEYLFTFSQEVVENQGKFLDNMFYDVYLLEKDIDISTLKLQKEEVYFPLTLFSNIL